MEDGERFSSRILQSCRFSKLPSFPYCLKWADDGKLAFVFQDYIDIFSLFDSHAEKYGTQNIQRRHTISLPPYHTSQVPMVLNRKEASSNILLSKVLLDSAKINNVEKLVRPVRTFTGGEWGPPHTGWNGTCVFTTITSQGDVSLYSLPSNSLDYECMKVDQVSEYLETHLSQHISMKSKGSLNAEEYLNYQDQLFVLSVAWSPLLLNQTIPRKACSLLALAGKSIVTIWRYDTLGYNQLGQLDKQPLLTFENSNYGWVLTCCWCSSNSTDLQLALGTSIGFIVLLHLQWNLQTRELVLQKKQIIQSPFCCSVLNVHHFISNQTSALAIASGAWLSIWKFHVNDEISHSVEAHDSNITGMVYVEDAFGVDQAVATCSSDGRIIAWDITKTLTLIKDLHERTNVSRTLEWYGLAASPNSAILASSAISAPVLKVTRETQVDRARGKAASKLELHPICNSILNSLAQQVLGKENKKKSLNSLAQQVLGKEDKKNSLFLWDFVWVIQENVYSWFIESSDDGNHDQLSLYSQLCDSYEKRYAQELLDSLQEENGLLPNTNFLQFLHLLHFNIRLPKSHPHDMRNLERHGQLQINLIKYWCQTVLLELSHQLDETYSPEEATYPPEEIESFFLMTDFLVSHPPLPKHLEKIVADIQHKFVRVPPENCFLCKSQVVNTITNNDKTVFFKSVCDQGHTLDRCMSTFRLIAIPNISQCSGCGYKQRLLDDHGVLFSPSKLFSKVDFQVCRMCNSNCFHVIWQ